MKTLLRKGSSSVYLQYENVGDSIGADNFTVAQTDGLIILSFNLRPIDSNQKADEQRIHSEQLREIHITDDYILDNLSTFLKSSNIKSEGFAVEINSLGKALRFTVDFGLAGLGFLPLLVKHNENQ